LTGGEADPAQLGKIRNATNEKAKRMAGLGAAFNEETIIATVESLVQEHLSARNDERSTLLH
jgi:hypothetical protein